ncbi:MAG: HAMP domain-containing protein, partial [Cyclobacteriaceae bacterium]|nr:HAMP domain-containing protein [Cyclobacteriaceae bacterium]
MKNIRAKLMLAFGVVLTLSLILSTWSIFSVQSIGEYQELDNQLKNIQIALLDIEKAEKIFIAEDVFKNEFYIEKISPSKATIKDQSEKINDILQQIIDSPLSEDFKITNICKNLQSYFIDFHKEFEITADLYHRLGYNEFGLEGEMRNVIHTIENSELGYDKSLMLMVRRHEKDFLLRKEVNYVTRFNQGIEALKSNVESTQTKSDIESQLKNSIIQNIYVYQEKFLDLVTITQKIGLTEKEGARAELRSILMKIEPVLEDMYIEVKSGIKYKKSQTIVLLVIIFIVQLVVALTFALIYSRNLTKKIVEIKDTVVALSSGNIPEPMAVSTQDELGESTQALNTLMERIKTAIKFSSEIGNGNLEYTYDEKYKEDVFAKSLISMKEKLKDIEQENYKSRWTNEGLAVFTEILHSSQDNLALFAERIITELTKYLDANQCAIYINDDDNDKTMNVMAVYAWGKKKYVSSTINYGEGLVGQAWQERKTLY